MGPSVPVKLDLKAEPRYLRFGYRNARLAVSGLQGVMPQQRSEKLTLGDAALLVLRQDQDAVLVFLWHGLRHDNETLKFDQVERWLERELDAGRDMSEFSLPILEALKEAHLITINYKPTVQDHDDDTKQTVGAFEAVDRLAPSPLARTDGSAAESRD